MSIFQMTLPLAEAVNKAVDECIEEDILADFLRKNKAEVIKTSIYEYDEEMHMQVIREEGEEKGRKEGRQQAKMIFKLHMEGKSNEEIVEICNVPMDVVVDTLD